MRKFDKLRNQQTPAVLGYELDPQTLTPVRNHIQMRSGDYGADPMPDGMFRMVPSGDIVSSEEKNKRLHKY